MKVFLINDTEKEYHWGCYGTSSAIKDQLYANGVDVITSFSCKDGSKLENSPRKCLSVYSKNPLIRYVSKLYFLRFFKKNLPELCKGIEESDYVIINGEGTINSIHIATRFIFFVVFLAKDVFNKKVSIINHSCYPKINKEKQVFYYKNVYSRCDFIAARERRSLHIITKILNVNATLSFDSLPLSIKDLKFIPPSYYSGKYVCLSGAVNYNVENSKFISECILEKYPDHKIIYLVGSASGINYEEPTVIKSLKQYMPKMIVHDAKSFGEWLSVIKYSEVLISGRYHYSIAAMCF
ncbi:polysaccharide pyruvyl transferase family protein [Salmonella enterica]|nr:polysaccharide pyruvyl transferase family protein [Salmonella enterica]EIL8818667.1 polysaccharide pyruvyl transferase family protein [Salmonella enterica]